jgi:hypothetical protein
MKNLFVCFCFFCPCCFLSCHDKTSRAGERADSSTRVAELVPGAPAAAQKSDTVLWLGIFARWNYGPGEAYDGNYDTTNNIFVMCSSKKAQVVGRAQIIFQASGNCDTAFNDRLKLMEIHRSTGQAFIVGDGVKLNDVSGPNAKIEYNAGNVTKVVELKAGETRRINSAVNYEKIIHNKQLMINPKTIH